MLPERSRWILITLGVLLLTLPAQTARANLDAGPYIQNVTPSGAELLYEGDDADGDGVVDFGTSPAYGSSTPATKRWAGDEHYLATLSGLSPNTRYFYRLTHEGEVREGWFFTAPAPGEPFTFAIIGDTRSNHVAHQDVVNAIIANDGYPDLLLVTGDLVADGNVKDQWQTFFAIEDDLVRHTVLCPVFGNHEQGEFFDPSRYNKYFDSGDNNKFWYAFAYGNALFLIINTETILDGDQGAFITDQLSQAQADPDIDFIFAFLHKPGVTTCTSHKPEYAVLHSLMDKLEAYNADVLFAGHNHYYDHGIVNGVHHIVTGGGGAGLGGLIEPYTPDGWTLVYREPTYHYCFVTVNDTEYTFSAKYVTGTEFDGYTATAADGGFPGPTPPDLLDRALDPGCGSFLTQALGLRVEDVEASALPTGTPSGMDAEAATQLHIAANGMLYGLPVLFLLGLRRRLRT